VGLQLQPVWVKTGKQFKLIKLVNVIQSSNIQLLPKEK